jgi:CheY-like chemotaxis protein
MCAGEIPERPFDRGVAPAIVVLHRSRLSPADVTAIQRWRPDRQPDALPRIVLCHGPYARYDELERASRAIDLMLPESTALETLPRHLYRLRNDGEDLPRRVAADSLPIEVVSSDRELSEVLTEALRRAGYRVASQHSLQEPATSTLLTIWDVPVLDHGWALRMEERSRRGPLIALLGFADRMTVTQARASGAAACLDLPFDLDDLLHVLNRIDRSTRLNLASASPGRAEPAHILPPPPSLRAGRGQTATGQAPRG